jgi:glycosyltransferase involved in cell wall biosynthesis
MAPVPQRNVAALYDRFDVLLAPSRWPESFGLVAREAARFGLWTVAPRSSAMADDLVEGVNGILIDTKDRTDLDKVFAKMNAEPGHFRRRMASPSESRRAASDQAFEFAALYRALLARA